MHTTSVVAALAAFASYASAAPAAEPGLVSDVAGKLAFSIPQVAGKKVFKNGAIARQRAFQKYGAPVPADLAHAAAAAVTGSVTASPEQYDSEYLCPVKTGADTLNLDFDTGSADLWVFSNKLPASQQSGHDIYHSGGTLKSGYTWSISYGDGSGAKGIVYADRVTVGGVTATSQAVEAATSISSQFAQDTDNDGLLGLAFSSINTVKPQQQQTFFDSVKGNLNSPLFAVTLKKGKPGTYDFGYIDSSKYSGSISYTSVSSSQGFWEFVATGYSIGSGSLKSTSIDGIADTGTTLLLLPDSIVNAYYAQVSGAQNSASAGGYVFPCSATLPSFSVYISGQKRVIPGSYMNFAPVSSTQCYGGLQSSSGIGINIFGDIFLKSQYVVFDSNGPRLGVAQQAGVTG